MEIPVLDRYVYGFPDDRLRATYAMGSPTHRQGSEASDLKGTIQIEPLGSSEMRVWVHLDASMVRKDGPRRRPFKEEVRAVAVLKEMNHEALTAWHHGRSDRPTDPISAKP